MIRKTSALLGIVCWLALAGTLQAQTTLYPGDLAIVGMDFNLSQTCPENSAFGTDDVVSFITFVDITNGTRILLTDNAFLREDSDGSYLFRSNEGAVVLERAGGTLPAGTVFEVVMGGSTFGMCAICSEGWNVNSVNLLNASNASNSVNPSPDMAISNGDQIIILQGDYLDNDLDCSGTWFDRIRGRVIYAGSSNITTPWVAGEAPPCGFGSATTTALSYLPVQASCLNIPLASKERGYLRNLPASGTQEDLLNYINDLSNWDAGNLIQMAPVGPCATTMPPGLRIVAADFTRSVTVTQQNQLGVWQGAVSTDWHDPCNWSRYVLPDSTINVLISAANAPVNDCVIDPASPKATSAPACRSLTLASGVRRLRFIGAAALRVFGDYNNQGDPTNLDEGTGTIELRGAASSSLATSGNSETFSNLTLNRSGAATANLGDLGLTVSNTLRMQQGVIRATGTGSLVVSNPAIDAVQNAAGQPFTDNQANTWIECPMSRRVTQPSVEYGFPVGGSAGPALYSVNFGATPHDYTDLAVRFVTQAIAELPLPNSECGNDGYDEWYQGGYWEAQSTPVSPANMGAYAVSVRPSQIPLAFSSLDYSEEVGGASATLAKSPTSSTSWTLDGDCDRSSHLNLPGARVLRTNVLTGFSKFGLLVDTGAPFALEDLSLYLASADNGKGLHLSWRHQNCQQVASWRVERSEDLRRFIELAAFSNELIESREERAGRTDQSYEGYFMDVTASCGQPVWYRLRIESVSGKVAYSHLLEGRFACPEEDGAASTTVYPNPFSDRLSFRFAQEDEGPARLQLFDALGRLVQQTEIQASETGFDWNLNDLPAGVYLLRMKLNGDDSSLRLMRR